MSSSRQSNELGRITSNSNARLSADICVFGVDQGKRCNLTPSAAPYSTRTSFDETPSGAQTPTPLLNARNEYTQKNGAIHSGDETYAMDSITRTRSHMGDALENLYKTQTACSQVTTGGDLGHEESGGLSPSSATRGRPAELSSLTTELIFVLVCSSGQLFFSFFQGNVNVNQQAFRLALDIQNTELPWMVSIDLFPLIFSLRYYFLAWGWPWE